MWEARFNTPDYVFGTEPAVFLREYMEHLVPGRTALSVADGEGRNSVFMAERGLEVTALEYAPSAVRKAKALAEKREAEVRFIETDVFDWDWPQASFDIVVAIFIQFVGPEDRARLFDLMSGALRHGGWLMLHGYTPKQLEFGTGGPKAEENLYTPELLREVFDGWTVEACRTYERELYEGQGHAGMSALIDFVAQKP